MLGKPSAEDERERAWMQQRAESGLKLSEKHRRLLSTRLMLQAPTGLTPRQVKAVADDLDKRIKGLPPGAFMALDALRLLAEQGNLVADTLFDQESARLGLTRPFSSYTRERRR